MLIVSSQCIVVAPRPLGVKELAEFLAFKSEAGGSITFEGTWRPENPKDTVPSTCSSLVTVVNVEGSAMIQFSHFSVKEYLTSSRIAEGHVSRYYIPLEPAHIFVAQACLSILLQLDKHVTKTSAEDLPLVWYAGQYWVEHAEFRNESSHTEDRIKRLFNPENHHFVNWVWTFDLFSGQSMVSESPSRLKRAPLHYAAQRGFHRVAEWLITTCSQDVNDRSCPFSLTPLHIASGGGQLTTVQVLLTHHADVNASDEDGWTPLHFASCFGHIKIAQLLLEHGADVNSKTSSSSTPLHCLSEKEGNLEVAQALLEHGADPSIRSSSGEDALYIAIQRGHQGLIQLLLKYGADPNTRDVDGQSLLHVSSERGDPKVAEGLLEPNIDVDSRDNQGRTPLQVALQNGNEEVVQLLSQHGAKGT